MSHVLSRAVDMDVLFAATVVPTVLATAGSPLWPSVALCSAFAAKEAFGMSLTSAVAVPASITFLVGAAIQEKRMEADLVLDLLILAGFMAIWPRMQAWLRLGIKTPEKVILTEAALGLLGSIGRSVLIELHHIWQASMPKAPATTVSDGVDVDAADAATGADAQAALSPIDSPVSPVLFVVQTLLAASALIVVALVPVLVAQSSASGTTSTGPGQRQHSAGRTFRLSQAVRSACLYSTVALVAGGGVYPLLRWKLGGDPFSWLLAFVSTPLRQGQLAWWCTVLVLMGVTSAFAAHKVVPDDTPQHKSERHLQLMVARKVFHYAVVAIMLPAVVLGPQAHALLALASAGATLVMVVIELARALDVWPGALSRPIHAYMHQFVDSRDGGLVYLTHLYLLVGCAAPVWLAYARPRPKFAPAVPSLLELAAGLLALGVGDAAAAVVGVSFTKAGTAHTWAWVVDRALTLMGSPDDDDDDDEEESNEGKDGSSDSVTDGPAQQALEDAKPSRPVRSRRASQSATPATRPTAAVAAPKPTPEELFTFHGSEKTVEGSVAFVLGHTAALVACHAARLWLQSYLASSSPDTRAILAPGYAMPGPLYWLVAVGIAVAMSVVETFAGGIDNAGLPVVAWAVSALASDWLDKRRYAH